MFKCITASLSRLLNVILLDLSAALMNDESIDELNDIDWRFAEFTSAPAHVLYSTCTELLALPVPGEQLGEELINVIFNWLVTVQRADQGCLLGFQGQFFFQTLIK